MKHFFNEINEIYNEDFGEVLVWMLLTKSI